MAPSLDLYCFLDGKKPRKAALIQIGPAETVGILIRAAVPGFNATSEISLWLVKIPRDRRGSEISIDDIADEDRTELSDTRVPLSQIFTSPPDENTYIIIQGFTSSDIVALHPNTILNKYKVALAGILQEATKTYREHKVDEKAAEEYQMMVLGTFYKKPLPYGATAKDINLVMLGNLLDKAPTSDDDETLCEIAEGDIGKTTGHSVVSMIGESGSGKTTTVVELAKKHFVIYCVCSSPNGLLSSDFKDQNFAKLAKEVEAIYQGLPTPVLRDQLISNDEKLKRRVGERVELEFLARLLFIQFLLDKNPDLTPEQFFREQTNGGAFTIGLMVQMLRAYDAITIQDMLGHVQEGLAIRLNSIQRGLVIALDDTQVAAENISAGKFISPSVSTSQLLVESEENLKIYRRGFLTPLCATLGDLCATIVTLGTSEPLLDVDHVYPAVEKRLNFTKITNFPLFECGDVVKVLSVLVDLSGCPISYNKCRNLTGRARLSVHVVHELIKLMKGDDDMLKRVALYSAISRVTEELGL